MQPTFIEFVTRKLIASGYTCQQETADDMFATTEGKTAWICYLHVEITPEQIRRCFEFPGYVLFVVDEKLMPAEIKDRELTPMWLRVIHGLYMGRVYTWNGKHLYGLHFDYDSGDVSESSAIDPTDLLLVETGTWLRGWAGIYRLARFYDRAWWSDSADERYGKSTNNQYSGDSSYRDHQYDEWKSRNESQKPPGGWRDEQTSSSRQSYEQARDNYQRQQQQREQSQGYNTRQEYAYYAPPKSADSKRDFMREFMACANLAQVKKLYRALAREFHPDLSGSDTTTEMQSINLAYEKAERMFK